MNDYVFILYLLIILNLLEVRNHTKTDNIDFLLCSINNHFHKCHVLYNIIINSFLKTIIYIHIYISLKLIIRIKYEIIYLYFNPSHMMTTVYTLIKILV